MNDDKKKAKPAADEPDLIDNTDDMIAKFTAESLEAMEAESAAYAVLPKVHDHTKGEYIVEVDPAKYDE